MRNVLTFIVPIRHQLAVKNWDEVKSNLAKTVRSLAAQDHEGWKAVIVANRGAQLPPMPERVGVKWVDFPPNVLPDMAKEYDSFWDAVRIDKGRRVLAGMLHAGEVGHFMVVDDDDFVSKKLTSFVAANQTANGWYFKNGYVWGSGGKLLFEYPDFSNFCGTSHIIRADLYNLPETFEEASDAYVRLLLGSHRFTRDHFEKAGTPLAMLPFIGAIYRIGHAEASSQSRNLISHFFIRRALVRHPLELIRRFSRLRFLTKKVSREFFGE